MKGMTLITICLAYSANSFAANVLQVGVSTLTSDLQGTFDKMLVFGEGGQVALMARLHESGAGPVGLIGDASLRTEKKNSDLENQSPGSSGTISRSGSDNVRSGAERSSKQVPREPMNLAVREIRVQGVRQVEVSWKPYNAEEAQPSEFELQTSSDGKPFKTLASLDAKAGTIGLGFDSNEFPMKKTTTFRLLARFEDERGKPFILYSNLARLVPKSDKPHAPTKLSVYKFGETLKTQFTEPLGVTPTDQYLVEVSLRSADHFDVINKIKSGIHEAQLMSVLPKDSIYVRIKTVTDDGVESDYSETVSYIPEVRKTPGSPKDIKISLSPKQDVLLTWSSSDSLANSYLIESSTDAVAFITEQTVTGDLHSATVLTAQKAAALTDPISYRIRASNEQGVSEPSDVVSFDNPANASTPKGNVSAVFANPESLGVVKTGQQTVVTGMAYVKFVNQSGATVSLGTLNTTITFNPTSAALDLVQTNCSTVLQQPAAAGVTKNSVVEMKTATVVQDSGGYKIVPVDPAGVTCAQYNRTQGLPSEGWTGNPVNQFQLTATQVGYEPDSNNPGSLIFRLVKPSFRDDFNRMGPGLPPAQQSVDYYVNPTTGPMGTVCNAMMAPMNGGNKSKYAGLTTKFVVVTGDTTIDRTSKAPNIVVTAHPSSSNLLGPVNMYCRFYLQH